jgi:hypothetical protein
VFADRFSASEANSLLTELKVKKGTLTAHFQKTGTDSL